MSRAGMICFFLLIVEFEGQQATIAYFEGWAAARRGDYAAAQQKLGAGT